MGADLYINTLYHKCMEKNKPLFDHAIFTRDILYAALDTLNNHHTPVRMESAQQEISDAGLKKSRESAQELVSYFHELMYDEGYFRDSYNDSSLLAELNLSWWKDVGDMLSKRDGKMSVPNMKKFLNIIMERKLPEFKEWVIQRAARHVERDKALAQTLGKERQPEKPMSEKELREWHQYFVKKREEFIKFLEQAIDMKEPIVCSI